MKVAIACASLLMLSALLFQCNKPDHILTVPSPREELFYTVQTYYGLGPVSSDFVRVYAHLKHDGLTDEKLVMDGDYLKFKRILWLTNSDVEFCLQDGFTNTFRNQVTLSTGGGTETIRNHLRDHC